MRGEIVAAVREIRGATPFTSSQIVVAVVSCGRLNIMWLYIRTTAV